MASRLHLLRHRDSYAQISQRDYDGPILQDRNFVVQPWNCVAERPCLFGLSPKVIGRRGTFSAISEPGQKTYVTLPSGKRVFRPFSRAAPRWPESILSGQAGFIILRGGGRSAPCPGIAIVPLHPRRRVLLQFFRVPLQTRSDNRMR